MLNKIFIRYLVDTLASAVRENKSVDRLARRRDMAFGAAHMRVYSLAPTLSIYKSFHS